MAARKITKRAVDALQWTPPGPPQQFLWDTALCGFGLYVLASGQKTYVVQFRRDGRSQRVKIGAHGPVTPDQAREEAKRILGRVAHGADPNAEKRERRAARTVSAIAEEWLDDIDEFRKPRTAAEYRRLVDVHVRPALGGVVLRNLTRAEVAAIRSSMRATPSLANKVLDVLSSMWSYAAKIGEVETLANPVKGVQRYRENPRERFLTVEELARLGDALRLGETEGLPYQVDEAKPKAKHAPSPKTAASCSIRSPLRRSGCCC
jgi:hypothetical protein